MRSRCVCYLECADVLIATNDLENKKEHVLRYFSRNYINIGAYLIVVLKAINEKTPSIFIRAISRIL